MAKGRKTGGRKKGTPNKVSGEIQGMIEIALDEVGGVQYLKEQARENPAAFMGLLGKILPRNLNHNVAGGLSISIGIGPSARQQTQS